MSAPPDNPALARADRRRRMLDVLLIALGLCVLAWLIQRGIADSGYRWQWYRVPRYLARMIDGEFIAGPLLRGLIITLQISVLALILAVFIGLVVALARLSRSWIAHRCAGFYLALIRNTPLLVQMYLFYFVLAPILGMDRFWTGVFCLAVFEASFIAEIIRGGLLAVERGQWEAAAGLGLSASQRYRKVVLPQALPLMLPPLTSALVNLIKNSAIVSTIAVFDLSNEARNVIADTFMSFEIWFSVAALYLLLTLSLSALAAWLERRLAQRRRARKATH